MTLNNQKVNSTPGKSSKKKYTPPSISYTEIETEEALMGLCKTAGSGGVPTGCSGGCSNPGS